MARPPSQQAETNAQLWQAGGHLDRYANRVLLPVEVLILVRYREALSGRVLEVGCGAGRVLGYLVALSDDVHGIDINSAMVEHCRSVYPAASLAVGDLASLQKIVQGPFDVVLAADNVLDVFDDLERRAVLRDIRQLLAPGGLLIFSSHNLNYLDSGGSNGTSGGRRPGAVLRKLVNRSPATLARAPLTRWRAVRNRRRLAPLQRRERDHAIINDEAHEFGLLHYYIRRDDQARQLDVEGYELVECLDPSGGLVKPGEDPVDPWLHFVARKTG